MRLSPLILSAVSRHSSWLAATGPPAPWRAPRRDVRASDAEREQTVQALRSHYAAGRLDREELERRVEQAYRAASRGKLRLLLADLPLSHGGRVARRFYRFQRELLHQRRSNCDLGRDRRGALLARGGAGADHRARRLARVRLALAAVATAARAAARIACSPTSPGTVPPSGWSPPHTSARSSSSTARSRACPRAAFAARSHIASRRCRGGPAPRSRAMRTGIWSTAGRRSACSRRRRSRAGT
ncbi:MAG: DUF1707 domain-containing protein [Actinobacteria bacterium]|nr:MAG: DUF1707 domain-containing protein [Actinomycetota bacterium]